MKYGIVLTFCWVLMTGISCTGPKTPSMPVVDEHQEHAPGNSTWLSDEQIRSIGLEFGVIEEKQLMETLKANGRLKVPNQFRANVNSLYRGIIKSLYLQPGKYVTQGQVLAIIQNPEFIPIQEEYLTLRSKIELAQLEYRRQEQLHQGNAGALKNLQSADSELRALQTRKASLHQQLRLMSIHPDSLQADQLISTFPVRAPISGTISEVLLDIGTYVDLSTTIAKIIDNHQLHLDLHVFEKDLPRIQNNQIIHFTLTNNPGKEYDAKIFSLGSTFEGESKVVSIHAHVEGNKTGLIDGMNVTAIISLSKATLLAIPTEAIVSHQGQDFIFVVSEAAADDGLHEHEAHVHTSDSAITHEHADPVSSEKKGMTFEKIPIARGISDIGYTQITLLNELPKETKIIVKGAFFLLAKLTNTGEHEH